MAVVINELARSASYATPLQGIPRSPSLPLDRPRRLARHIIHNPIDPPHLIDNPRRRAPQKPHIERIEIRRHPVDRSHRRQRADEFISAAIRPSRRLSVPARARRKPTRCRHTGPALRPQGASLLDRLGSRQHRGETIGISSLERQLQPSCPRSPDFSGGGPATAPMASPGIFYKSRIFTPVRRKCGALDEAQALLLSQLRRDRSSSPRFHRDRRNRHMADRQRRS